MVAVRVSILLLELWWLQMGLAWNNEYSKENNNDKVNEILRNKDTSNHTASMYYIEHDDCSRFIFIT